MITRASNQDVVSNDHRYERDLAEPAGHSALTSSRTCRNSGGGARHMVRYVSRKGSQRKNLYFQGFPPLFSLAGFRFLLATVGTFANSAPQQRGTVCAMVFVFDDIEEMQACCGCPVTPDGLRTMSVINNVTKNFGVNRGNLNAGAIDIISTFPNFCATRSIPLSAQIGPIGVGLGGLFFACDPSGEFGPLVGATSGDLFADQWPDSLIAYETHSEGMTPVPSGGALVKGVSVDEFAPVDLVGSGNDVEELEKAFAFF